MGNMSKIYYKKAVDLFENNKYDESVGYFIKSYEAGFLQDEILDDLYSCFVTPNQQEFRDTYYACDIDKLGVEFDDTVLDFIPVTDTKYYIFHKIKKQFYGALDLDETVKEIRRSAESILIADSDEMEQIIQDLQRKRFAGIYFVLQKQAAFWMSFLKIPGFAAAYLEQARTFADLTSFADFFESDSNIWLPRCIYADDTARYMEVIDRIHTHRINDVSTNRNNILLSICIPSYNRGMLALEAVQNILSSAYDAEIEVVLSNNGSEDKEGYDKIKGMKDSRVSYHAFDENKGYACNVVTVLEKAKGRFAICSSDEDLLVLEALPGFLDLLMESEEYGLIFTDGDGPNFSGEAEFLEIPKGSTAVAFALGRNYITGNAYNKKFMQKNKVFSQYEKYKDMNYVQVYTHCALAVLTVENVPALQTDIHLWKSYEYIHNINEEGPILSYMTHESRIEQQNSAVQFIQAVVKLEPLEVYGIILNRMQNTYRLYGVVAVLKTEQFYKEHDWMLGCIMIYKSNIEIVRGMDRDSACIPSILEAIVNTFLEYLKLNPVQELQSEEEKRLYDKMTDIIEYQLTVEKKLAGLNYDDVKKKALKGLDD